MSKSKRSFAAKIQEIPTWILLLLTLFFFIPVFLIYYKESVSFHFIDEYNNFLAGYFLIKGKTLYSQIFFQHQPFMAYISYVIQKVLHPNTLYKLVIYHRLAVVFIALIFDLLLVYRFRFIGLGFAVIFELTKYYLFGSTFLAESVVVYPLVYLLGLVWEVLQKRALATWEIWISSILTFFIVFMREPYIPTAIILFAILLTTKKPTRIKLGAVALFLVLSGLIIASLPIPSYLYEMTTVNFTAVATGEIQTTHLNGPGIITIFIYPLLILVSGLVNYFRGVLILVDLTFLLAIFVYIVKEKQGKNGIILLLILGITNIRITPPSTLFFGAYHMLVWYGLFVFSTLLLVKNIYVLKKQGIYQIATAILIVILFVYLIIPANSFLWARLDRQVTFTTNYGQYYSNGEVVHDLADSNTTVFVDGWDSLMYWQADQPVAYPYLFYYQPMSGFSLYTNARAEMFKKNPPEFVYSSCKLVNKKLLTYTFTEYSSGAYEIFNYGKTPTCLFIRKSAIKSISNEKWNLIKQFGYSL